MSPSGREAFNGEVVNVATGRIEHIPSSRSGGTGSAGVLSGEYTLEHSIEYLPSPTAVWATPELIVGNTATHVVVLDVRTRKWTAPVDLGPEGDTAVYCPLQSGQVLLATVRWPRDTYKLYLATPGSRHLAAINSAGLGTIHAMSCPASGHTVYVSAGTFPATLYVASDPSIDGSPWTK
jgi:hypothetical protein